MLGEKIERKENLDWTYPTFCCVSCFGSSSSLLEQDSKSSEPHESEEESCL